MPKRKRSRAYGRGKRRKRYRRRPYNTVAFTKAVRRLVYQAKPWKFQSFNLSAEPTESAYSLDVHGIRPTLTSYNTVAQAWGYSALWAPDQGLEEYQRLGDEIRWGRLRGELVFSNFVTGTSDSYNFIRMAIVYCSKASVESVFHSLEDSGYGGKPAITAPWDKDMLKEYGVYIVYDRTIKLMGEGTSEGYPTSALVKRVKFNVNLSRYKSRWESIAESGSPASGHLGIMLWSDSSSAPDPLMYGTITRSFKDV